MANKPNEDSENNIGRKDIMSVLKQYTMHIMLVILLAVGTLLWTTFSAGAEVKFNDRVAAAVMAKMEDPKFIEKFVNSRPFMVAMLGSPLVAAYMKSESDKMEAKIETKIFAELSRKDSIEIVATMQKAMDLGIRDEQIELLQMELLQAYKDGKLSDKPSEYTKRRVTKIRARYQF